MNTGSVYLASTILLCDFCSKPSPNWRYPASEFTTVPEPEQSPATSIGDWAACDTCHDLIEASEWIGLCVRSTETLIAVRPDLLDRTDEIAKVMVSLHCGFRDHRGGPPTHIAPRRKWKGPSLRSSR